MMRRQKVMWGLWAAVLLFVSTPALGTQGAGEEPLSAKAGTDASQAAQKDSGAKSLTFGSGTAPEKAVAPGDFKGMLAVCDGKLDSCQKNEVGITFLAAAYLALWLILMAFLYVTQRGQKRLQFEFEELNGRLKDLEGGAG